MKMKQYRLAKEFLGFRKGTELLADSIRHMHTLNATNNAYITLQTVILEANPDIFEEVKSVEDSIDEILTEFVSDNKNVTYNTLLEEYRNKILALIDTRIKG